MMNCADYQDLIHSYLGDELESALRGDLESHLFACSECGREAATWQTCLRRLRETFPEQAPPAELWDKIQTKTQ